MAADARADVFVSSFHGFFRPVSVCKQAPANRYHVGIIVFKRLLSHIRYIEFSSYDNRYFNSIFKLFRVRQVKAVFLINRRVAPVPRIISAKVGVQFIVSGAFQNLRGLQAFFEGAALFFIFFIRKAALPPVFNAALNTEPKANRKVFADCLLYSLHNLNRQRKPAAQVTAVLVRAVVEHRDRKLIQKVPFVHRVDFNAIISRSNSNLSRFSEFFYNRLNFFCRQGAACYGRVPIIWYGRSGNRLLCHKDRGTASAESHGKLQKDLCTVGMHPLCQFC